MPSKQLEIKEEDIRIAAEEQGHRYIKVRLGSKRTVRGSKEIAIHGVKELRGYAAGKDDDGIARFDFVVEGGVLKFRFERKERAYIGYMFDDKEEAINATKGYNRDVLATHYKLGDFIVEDEKVIEDVERRVKRIHAKIERDRLAKKNAPETLIIAPKEDEKDIDEQIATLKAKQELIRTNREKNERPAPRPAKRRIPRAQKESPEVPAINTTETETAKKAELQEV